MTEASDSAPAAVAQSPGQMQEFPRPFGQYLLLHRLARGGMGEVFLAKHGNLAGIEKYCVVKTLRGNYTVDREYVARFIDEARVVVQLNHRNICQIFDVGRVGQQYFLAMEFIVGRDLRTIQTKLKNRGQTLGEDLILHVVCEVLEALDYAHRHTDPVTGESLKLVHRDVSPQNVMVNFEGEIKLIDFGLAQSTKKVEQTQPHVVMGKMQYMAPEQARGDGVDGRADQFAVAMLLYELLAGERFYEAMSFDEIWQIAGRGGFTPRRMERLDDTLRAILEKALSADREERFATCGDFREALLGYQFDRRMRAGSRNVRGFMLDAFPDDAAAHRELLARFQKVSAMPQTAVEEAPEESQSFARSRPNESSPVIPLRPDEKTVIDGEVLGDTMAQALEDDTTASRERAPEVDEDANTLELPKDMLQMSSEEPAAPRDLARFRSLQADTSDPFDTRTPTVSSSRSPVVQNKTHIIRSDEIPAAPGHGDPRHMAPRRSRSVLLIAAGAIIAVLLGVVVGLAVLRTGGDSDPAVAVVDEPAAPPADDVEPAAAPAEPAPAETAPVAADDEDPAVDEDPTPAAASAEVDDDDDDGKSRTRSSRKTRRKSSRRTKRTSSKAPEPKAAEEPKPAAAPAPAPAAPAPPPLAAIDQSYVKLAKDGTPRQKLDFLKDQGCVSRGATCARGVRKSALEAMTTTDQAVLAKWTKRANQCIDRCAKGR